MQAPASCVSCPSGPGDTRCSPLGRGHRGSRSLGTRCGPPATAHSKAAPDRVLCPPSLQASDPGPEPSERTHSKTAGRAAERGSSGARLGPAPGKPKPCALPSQCRGLPEPRQGLAAGTPTGTGARPAWRLPGLPECPQPLAVCFLNADAQPRPHTACTTAPARSLQGAGLGGCGPSTTELVTRHPAASGDRPSQTPSP